MRFKYLKEFLIYCFILVTLLSCESYEKKQKTTYSKIDKSYDNKGRIKTIHYVGYDCCVGDLDYIEEYDSLGNMILKYGHTPDAGPLSMTLYYYKDGKECGSVIYTYHDSLDFKSTDRQFLEDSVAYYNGIFERFYIDSTGTWHKSR